MQRFMRTRRDDGDAQFIRQELYRVQSRPLVTQLARQKVLDLIDQKHAGRCVLKHSNCPSFEFMEPHGG
jgi:hypothetical protein